LSGKCAPLIAAGAPCNETNLCQVGLLCVNNNCTKIGSIENGKAAVVPATCKSYYMEDNKCTDGPILNETEKKLEVCPSSGECHYSFKGDANKKITEPCVCGMTQNATGICRPGEGDTQLDDVRKKMSIF
jgi:hypothetical protein